MGIVVVGLVLSVGVGVGDDVGVKLGEFVGDDVGVKLGVFVGDDVRVSVGVFVGAWVDVSVAVRVDVGRKGDGSIGTGVPVKFISQARSKILRSAKTRARMDFPSKVTVPLGRSFT